MNRVRYGERSSWDGWRAARTPLGNEADRRQTQEERSVMRTSQMKYPVMCLLPETLPIFHKIPNPRIGLAWFYFLWKSAKKARLGQKFVQGLDSARWTKGQLPFQVMLINWKCMTIRKASSSTTPGLMSKGKKNGIDAQDNVIIIPLNSEG